MYSRARGGMSTPCYEQTMRRLVVLLLAVGACGSPTSIAATAPSAPTAVVAALVPLTPVHLHATGWQQLCGTPGPEPKGGRCTLAAVDEDEDGSALVTGSFEGSTPLFGTRTTSGTSRSLLIARFSPTGAVQWIKAVGKKPKKDILILNSGQRVLALGSGLVALAGVHGPDFDLGGGSVPVGPRSGLVTLDGFFAILRNDGSPSFAANLDALAFGAERSLPLLELVPFGIHHDGTGGAWVLAGRPDAPLVAVHLSSSGVVLARIQYPVVLRRDVQTDTLSLHPTLGSDRIIGSFNFAHDPGRSMAIAPDGTLAVIDADPTPARGLVLHRFLPSGVEMTPVQLDLKRPPTGWWQAFVAMGKQGEAYVAASSDTQHIKTNFASSAAAVYRIDADGTVRWVWNAAPIENYVTMLGVSISGSVIKAVVAFRDNLVAAPDARVPTPTPNPTDSAGTPGLAVITFGTDGRVQSADGFGSASPCPDWIPALVTNVVASKHLWLLAPARDVTPGVCGNGFGFNGGVLITSMTMDP